MSQNEIASIIEVENQNPMNLIKQNENNKVDKQTFLERLERRTDWFVVWSRELSSRGMSFLIAMLGVILQASHTTLLMYSVSGFSSNILKFLVALGLGVFISSALAIFTIKFDGEDENIKKIIMVFFYFEIFSNLFYYFNSLIFNFVSDNFGFENVPPKNWLFLIICLPFAYVVPFTIKQFSGVIVADKKLKFGSIDNPFEEEEKTETENKAIIDLKNQVKSIDSDVYANKLAIEALDDKVTDIDKKTIKQGQAIKIPVGDQEYITTVNKN